MRATDWTCYRTQDEVRPMEYHPDWPDELQELGLIMVPAGNRASFNQKRVCHGPRRIVEGLCGQRLPT